MRKHEFGLTLAVTTRERPDALAAVLASIARQSVPPDELIVADDGSGPQTRNLIEHFASSVAFPVRHVRQDYRGFRVARLRNLAIAHATGEYIVFVDGDMLLHPAFLADHFFFARRGAFTQGVRVPLDAGATARLLAKPSDIPRVFDRGLGGRRRIYTLHNRTLARLARRVANGFIAIKSCNLGLWRSDLLAVNGFDEDFVGWGSEDKELCARLRHGGVARQTLLFGGIAFHLHHPPASREHYAENERILAVTRAQRRVRCEHGVSAHLRDGAPS